MDYSTANVQLVITIYGKDWMIKTANNIAHHLLYKGCLNPYVWEAQITWDFKAEK